VEKDLLSGLLFFVIALVIRSLPELIVPGYPVGFETITIHAPPLMFPTPPNLGWLETFGIRFQFLLSQKPLLDTFRAGPLFYLLSLFMSSFNGINGFLILKIAGPLLFGGLVISFYFFVKRGLKLDSKVAFLATLLMVFQLAALRESSDRYRTELALIFFFAALTVLRREWKLKWPIIGLLGIMTVLSRDYVGGLLFITIVGSALYERKDRIISTAAVLPIFVILLGMFNPVWVNWNYLLNSSPFSTGDYVSMVNDVFFIFVILYLPLLPIAIRGFFKSNILTPMLLFLLLGSFSVVVIPWMAIPGYQRWLTLLVFPLTVYAAFGLRYFFSDKRKLGFLAAILVVFIIIGLCYSTGLFSYTREYPNSWLPRNLTESSIPWNEVSNLTSCLNWLGNNSKGNSALLVEERFYGWSLIYLKPSEGAINVKPYVSSASFSTSFEEAKLEGNSEIFLIGYSNRNAEEFRLIHSEGVISAYVYEPLVVQGVE
jgi:hypothetical protein